MNFFFLLRCCAVFVPFFQLASCGSSHHTLASKSAQRSSGPAVQASSGQKPAQPAKTGKKPADSRQEKNLSKPGDLSYGAWYKSFRTRALAKGVFVRLFNQVFEGVGPDSKILSLLERQPEFTTPVWDYMDKRLSKNRIHKGQRLLEEKTVLFEALETRYGVPKSIVAAIWGLETHYGAVMGNHDTVSALATLAMKQRKRAFAEAQLYAIFDVLASGSAERSWLKGSWAGAMGHVQFIPTSYRRYAVDYDGDGHKNIWSDERDALASAAFYLKSHGWKEGFPCAEEVRLPGNFDFRLLDNRKRSLDIWKQAGITPVQTWPQHLLSEEARLYLPAGAQGPAFLTFKNFDVVKRYNNADAYALSVCRLAERLKGRPSLVQSWPRHERTLKRFEVKQIQTRLKSLGFDPGPPDGVVGRQTREAAKAYQRAHRLIPDGFIGNSLYQRLIKENAGVQP